MIHTGVANPFVHSAASKELIVSEHSHFEDLVAELPLSSRHMLRLASELAREREYGHLTLPEFVGDLFRKLHERLRSEAATASAFEGKSNFSVCSDRRDCAVQRRRDIDQGF